MWHKYSWLEILYHESIVASKFKIRNYLFKQYNLFLIICISYSTSQIFNKFHAGYY